MTAPGNTPVPNAARFRRISLLFAALLTLACGGSSAVRTQSEAAPIDCPRLDAVFPAAEWERIAQPECAGWSRAGLARVTQTLSTMATTGMMAVVGGRVLFEYGDVEAVSYLASVRKSILSMLYGIYVDRGIIDLDETLAQNGIDDVGGLTDAEKQATVRHLLMARSGVYHEASNGGDDLASAPPRGSQQPGTYYLYSNWDFNALGTIFETRTGRSIYDALDEHIVQPLGMRDFDRSTHRRTGNASRSVHLAYHMNLSTRDMARVGYLMLRMGEWNGRRIVPRDWVIESTRAHTRVHEMNPTRRRSGPFGYGYLWWVFDNPDRDPVFNGAYAGLGAIGQQILVVPALDLVVVHKTRPGQPDNASVSHGQFLEVVDLLLRARCADACAASLRPAA
jgi:CubicO group peptidase (beta-lactamase class C family)